MIKVSVLYPNEDGKTFDLLYYRDKHIPLVKQLLGSSCVQTSIDKGISGGTPGSKAAYATMGHLYFHSMDDFISAFVPHAKKILHDLPNFTDTSPVFQISEVID
jgi:uncharacterized protein (TIGR02118 family)